jgi:hypothetical protein
MLRRALEKEREFQCLIESGTATVPLPFAGFVPEPGAGAGAAVPGRTAGVLARGCGTGAVAGCVGCVGCAADGATAVLGAVTAGAVAGAGLATAGLVGAALTGAAAVGLVAGVPGCGRDGGAVGAPPGGVLIAGEVAFPVFAALPALAAGAVPAEGAGAVLVLLAFVVVTAGVAEVAGALVVSLAAAGVVLDGVEAPTGAL